MNTNKENQDDSIHSALSTEFHEVIETKYDYLDVETRFSDITFQKLEQFDNSSSLSDEHLCIRIEFSGDEFGSGLCYLKKDDLKTITDQIMGEESEDDGISEEMIDVGKEFTNLVCGRLIKTIENQFGLNYSFVVPDFTDPCLPILLSKENGPFGILNAKLQIGSTQVPCELYLVVEKQGLHAMQMKSSEGKVG